MRPSVVVSKSKRLVFTPGSARSSLSGRSLTLSCEAWACSAFSPCLPRCSSGGRCGRAGPQGRNLASHPSLATRQRFRARGQPRRSYTLCVYAPPCHQYRGQHSASVPVFFRIPVPAAITFAPCLAIRAPTARIAGVLWARSSVGRAPPSHGGGQGFESPRVHPEKPCKYAQNCSLRSWYRGSSAATVQQREADTSS